MPLSSILGFQSDKWDNPKESLGAPVGPLQRGRYRCWEAAGKARQAFRELSPEIKDYLEACSIPPTDIVSWSMYMIGHTAETAAPKLFICSTDVKARKYIRKLIKDSKIMEKYPGIGLGDVSALPDRHVIRQLAREAIQALLPPDCDADRAVLAEGSEALLGKRLFIVNPNDFSLRPVTAGPVILQRYQLTVAHVFQHNSEPNLSLDYGAAEDDCDFDGMSDDEGDDGSQDVEITRRGSVSTDGMDSDKDSFTARLDMLSSEEDSDTGSISPSSDYLRIEHGSQRSAEFVSDNTYQHDLDVSLLRFYGRLVLSSLTGSNPSLDYALIEIAPEMVENVKQIPLCGSTVDSLVISTIESDDVDIIAATSECCLAEGRLTATPSYFRFPGHGSFQQVYPVRLDKALADGDCGAAVFGKDDRRFYGHVVAGGPGTGVAYIVPASEISKDVEARLGHGLEPTTRECEKSTKELSQTSAKPAPNAELSESTVKYPFGTITCPSVQWRKSTPERVSDLKSSSVHPYTLDPSEPQQSLTSRSTLQPHTSQLSPVGGRNRSSKLSFSPPDHVSRLTTTPPPTSPSPMSHVLIRRLPLSASEESLRLMMVWSRKLVNIELLPVEESEDPGFCSAVLTFQTLDGAREAKDMLDGRPNIYNNAEMIVEILSKSPLLAPQFPEEITSMNMSTTRGKHPTRFSSSFHSIKSILPQTNSEYLPQKFPELDMGAHNQNLLSPQPCKGNHLTKLSMVSGQTLIANDSHGNGKTSDLLKYPYIESGVTIQRLAAVPQIPISRLAALSLNSNIEPTPGLVSLPPHMSAAGGKSSPLLPMDEPGFSMLYPDADLPYRRRHFPGVNPADENPPCNTLYVGNLPTETSEEELKALFSKQRGYKRLCFRTKHNGPMCFVEFEDVSLATEALHKLYGQSLSNSVRGGIRLSFSKNPLGIRSGPTRGHGSSDVLSGMDGIIPGGLNGFPPVLTPPPSLETGHFNHYGSAASHPTASCSGIANHGWKSPTHSGHIAASPRGVNTPPASFPSLYMTGR